MQDNSMIDTNSIMGTVLSIGGAIITIDTAEGLMKIIALAFTIVAAATTIWYNYMKIKSHKKYKEDV